MQILGRAISDATEEILKSIVKKLLKPIYYFPLESSDGGFGKAGQDEERYYVWLDPSLPEHAFETNFLHELIHLTQMERNIPDARPVNANAEGELKFAAAINATILDLEVEEKLKKYGYDTSYFAKARLNKIRTIRNKGFPNYANNEFLQKLSSLNLALYSTVATKEISTQMFDCFSKRYPRIVSNAISVIKLIDVNMSEDSEKMFKIMKSLIELFIIGNHIKLIYNQNIYVYSNSLKQWETT